jgi:hypothetical protein
MEGFHADPDRGVTSNHHDSARTRFGRAKSKLADYEGAIENGKLAGDKISFETTIEPGKVSFDGTVAG